MREILYFAQGSAVQHSNKQAAKVSAAAACVGGGRAGILDGGCFFKKIHSHTTSACTHSRDGPVVASRLRGDSHGTELLTLLRPLARWRGGIIPTPAPPPPLPTPHTIQVLGCKISEPRRWLHPRVERGSCVWVLVLVLVDPPSPGIDSHASNHPPVLPLRHPRT